MSPHSDPSRCVRWSCDAPCRKLLFIVSEKVRQMAPGVGLGRPSSGPEEATSKWGRSYKWAADLKITWRGGKRRGTVTDRASRRGGEGRGGEGRWDGTIGSPAQRIGASLRHATTSIIPEGMEASSPWLYNDTCPSESLRKKGIQGKILSVEGRGGGGRTEAPDFGSLGTGASCAVWKGLFLGCSQNGISGSHEPCVLDKEAERGVPGWKAQTTALQMGREGQTDFRPQAVIWTSRGLRTTSLRTRRIRPSHSVLYT